MAFSCGGDDNGGDKSPQGPGNGGGGGTTDPGYAGLDSYFGTNMSGGEFGGVYPGVIGTHYGYPTKADLQYFKNKGLCLIRFPFRWERLQYQMNGPLTSIDLNHMKNVVGWAEELDMPIILDMHNFCRYSVDGGTTATIVGATSECTADHLGDVWLKLAQEFKDYDNIWGYDIMNEPYGMPTRTLWFEIAQKVIYKIRSVDTETPIIISGDAYSSASRWVEFSDNLRNLTDPSNKLIYQAHVYFDATSGGTYGKYVDDVFVPSTYAAEGANAQTGVTRVKPFVEWLQKYDKEGFIGEYGIPDDAADSEKWGTVLENMLKYMQENGVPGTYWSAGPRWDGYRLAIQPSNNHPVDRPQMKSLEKYKHTKP